MGTHVGKMSHVLREAYTVIWTLKYPEASWECRLQQMPIPIQVST